MRKSRFTEEQIAFALKQAETGTPVAEVIRRMGVSEQTFYRWKKLYGGLGTGELRRNLSVTGLIGLATTDYEGVRLKEGTITAGARVEYKLTRSVAVRASYIHERLKSTAPGSDYTANTYLLGLRFNP